MLNIEEVIMNDSESRGKRILYSIADWQEFEYGRKFPDKLKVDKDDIIDKIKNKYLKITCLENQYIDFLHTKQTSISSDNNSSKDKLRIYENKPKELYIDLSDGIIEMSKTGLLIKKYMINVLSSSNYSVEEYGIILLLKYKNNGITFNPDFSIDIEVAIHKLNDENLIMNAVNISFWSYVIYNLILCIYDKSSFALSNFDYVSFVILVTYLAQLIFRTKYIRNTYINKLFRLIKWLTFKSYRKNFSNKDRFSKRSFKKDIISNHKKSKEKINWEFLKEEKKKD